MNLFRGFAEEGDAAAFLLANARAARSLRSETLANRTGSQTQSRNTGQTSIEVLPDGKKYVRADRQVIFGNDPASWSEQLERYINKEIRNGRDVQLIAEDGDVLTLTATSAGKLSSYYTNDGRTMSDEAYERKADAAAHINELVQTSRRGRKTVQDKGKRHGDMASGGWNYRTAYFQDFDGKYYEITISVAQNADRKMVYNIGQMQERSIPQIDGSSAASSGALRGNASSVDKLAEKGGAVKQNFSRELDRDGRELTAGKKVSRVDGRSVRAYNGTRRSPALNDVIAKLNTGEYVDVQTILRTPEIAYAEQANEGTPTIELPGRETIRQTAYEKAMRRGSWDGKGFHGPVRQERRMDIVLGLPGSGKSSVYTEPLSQEHGSRVVDTDDYRADIPEYNGTNAALVHKEASQVKKRVLETALENGDNILLSIIGDNADKLLRDISVYEENGYSVYLHLNELPNSKAMARAINRYVSEDGTLGRYVSPKLIAEYADKPTQTYLYLTGQGGNTNGRLGEAVQGDGRRGRGVAASLGSQTQSGEGSAASLAGWDWYNNDVAYGEAPRLIQSSENGTPAGEAGARFSRDLDSAGRELTAGQRENVNTKKQGTLLRALLFGAEGGI